MHSVVIHSVQYCLKRESSRLDVGILVVDPAILALRMSVLARGEERQHISEVRDGSTDYELTH